MMSKKGGSIGKTFRSFLSWVLVGTVGLALACNPAGDLNETNDGGTSSQEQATPSPTAAVEVTQPAISEHLKGRIGSSTQWDSGWMDLEVTTSFKRGEQLRIRVGGTAHTVLVRLLEEGADPNDPVGLDGGAIRVPEDRVVQLVLEQDHDDVVQISVHGGPNPWNLYPLGGDNGPATILSVQRVTS